MGKECRNMGKNGIQIIKEEPGKLKVIVRDTPLTFVYDGMAVRLKDHDPRTCKIPPGLLSGICMDAAKILKKEWSSLTVETRQGKEE